MENKKSLLISGNRNRLLIFSLIAMLFISVFVIANSSEAHTIQGYAQVYNQELNAEGGTVIAYVAHHVHGNLVEIGSSTVGHNGWFSISFGNGVQTPLYLRLILPRIGEEIEVGTWYPAALTFEEADGIIFPHGGPPKTEEETIYFYVTEIIEAAGPSAKITGNVGDNSRYGIEDSYVIVKNANGIYGKVFTDPEGNYELDNIPYGYYQIISTKIGYKSVIQDINVGTPEVTHNFTMSHMISYTTISEVTAENFTLSQNFPNPFNPETKISFTIPEDSKVTLIVSDMSGREVANLVNNDMKAGSYVTNFNASDLSSGVYIYRINVTGISGSTFSDMKRMVLLK